VVSGKCATFASHLQHLSPAKVQKKPSTTKDLSEKVSFEIHFLISDHQNIVTNFLQKPITYEN
jgi:hypothetical protein